MPGRSTTPTASRSIPPATTSMSSRPPSTRSAASASRDGDAATPELVCARGALEWMPDGIAFDGAGALYVTMYATDRIYRIEPGGEPEILVEDVLGLTLNRPTNCAFGGPNLDRLFVANLGGRLLSVVDLGRPGQPLYGGPRRG